ncbi:unnamed protein product [Brassica oleracea]
MRATLDFHGFSGGFTTVRQFLSCRWSSNEMMQGVGKVRLHMRACGEYLLRVVVLNRWVSKVQMCSDAPLHLGSSPFFSYSSTQRRGYIL